MHHTNKLNLIFTTLRQLLLDHTTVQKHTKTLVQSYPHSDTVPSERKFSAVNFGMLKFGEASLYYLKQGAPGFELMMLIIIIEWYFCRSMRVKP